MLVGLGFIGSMALLVVLWTCNAWFVEKAVQSQVEAFERALAQASIRPEECERGRTVARELGDAVTKERIKRDENFDEWQRVERILADFTSDTAGGEKVLSPVEARSYIDRMEEVLDDLKQRRGGEPPKPH